jgi:hypothetical protein
MSITGATRRLGLRPAGGNFATMRKLIARLEISTNHFDPNWTRRASRRPQATPLNEVLVDGSHYDRAYLKRRLYEEGIKSPSCELCGQGDTWRGRKMSLILDHVNGVPTDNRIGNLRIVCPNCAATFDTHCARKNRREREPRACLHCGARFIPRYEKHRYCSQPCGVDSKSTRSPHPAARKVPRPSYDQLMSDVKSMSMLAVGRKYGVSDNAVRKWIRWYEYQHEIDLRPDEAA